MWWFWCSAMIVSGFLDTHYSVQKNWIGYLQNGFILPTFLLPCADLHMIIDGLIAIPSAESVEFKKVQFSCWKTSVADRLVCLTQRTALNEFKLVFRDKWVQRPWKSNPEWCGRMSTCFVSGSGGTLGLPINADWAVVARKVTKSKAVFRRMTFWKCCILATWISRKNGPVWARTGDRSISTKFILKNVCRTEPSKQSEFAAGLWRTTSV